METLSSEVALATAGGASVIALCAWIFYPVYQSIASQRVRTPDEFICEERDGVSDLALSLVVPAYNEELRLQKMLDPCLEFLEEWSELNGIRYELILVDDHSTDKTAEIGLSYMSRMKDYPIRLLKLSVNRGKGGAIRRGVMRSRGAYVLMVDADGASDIRDLSLLWSEIKAVEQVDKVTGETIGMAIGSRSHLNHSSVAKRSLLRTILMKGFHALVCLLCTRNIRDTQCGFKLFTSSSARLLFGNLHLERWAFDTEIIYLAEKLGHPIAEVGIRWQEVAGSKLIQSKWDVVTTSLTMARDMMCVCVAYGVGLWKYPSQMNKRH